MAMKEVDLLILNPTRKADWSTGCQRAQQQTCTDGPVSGIQTGILG